MHIATMTNAVKQRTPNSNLLAMCLCSRGLQALSFIFSIYSNVFCN